MRHSMTKAKNSSFWEKPLNEVRHFDKKLFAILITPKKFAILITPPRMTHQYDLFAFIWIVQWGRSKFQVRKLNWASSAWFAVWSSPSNWESCHACFTPAIYSWDGCQFHSENICSVASRQFVNSVLSRIPFSSSSKPWIDFISLSKASHVTDLKDLVSLIKTESVRLDRYLTVIIFQLPWWLDQHRLRQNQPLYIYIHQRLKLYSSSFFL